MKRYFCFILLVSLFILAYFSLKREMLFCVNDFNIEYEIIDNNTVKISEKDLQNFIENLDINILRISEISDRKIIEGYTSKIYNYFVVDNLKINIQISLNNGTAIIGSPLIFGSF